MLFDLTRDPWIPVRRDDHTLAEVGLTEALASAHRLRLAAVGTERVVLLRWLAALWDAADGPSDLSQWARRWRSRSLDCDRVSDYLAAHRAAFDLIDGWALGQSPDLDRATRTAHVLDPSTWGGAATALFGPDGPVRPLPAASAARALLVLQAMHPGGIQSGHPQDPRTRGGRVYGGKPGSLSLITHLHAEPEGATLKDLLLLAVPPRPRAAGDQPAWERPAPAAAGGERIPRGRLDWWTWPTRRPRLVPDRHGMITAVALHDGDRCTDPVTAARTHDPLAAFLPPAQTTTGPQTPRRLPLLSPGGHLRAWSAVLALPDDHDHPEAPAAAPILEHLAAICRHGHLPDRLPIRVLVHRSEHTTAHRAALASVTCDLLPLGLARTLADPARTTQLRAAALAAARTQLHLDRCAQAASTRPEAPLDLAADLHLADAFEQLCAADGANEEADAFTAALDLAAREALTERFAADPMAAGHALSQLHQLSGSTA